MGDTWSASVFDPVRVDLIHEKRESGIVRHLGTPIRRSTQAEMADCWPHPHASPSPRFFEYLPIGLFAAVMGITGLSIAWRLAAPRYGAPLWIANGIGIVAAVTFATLVTAYLIKMLTAFDAVRSEFQHPLAGNLFGTVPISLLLLPMILPTGFVWLARTFWCIGTAAILAFAWLVVRRWMRVKPAYEHTTPAWIVPVVGILDVPLATGQVALPQSHVLVVSCFTIGIFFAIPLFTIIFSRLIFEEPMPGTSRATLLILTAPFAVGFSAYVAVTGQVDGFAEGLFGLMLFILAVLLSTLGDLPRCCPFRVAWWAVSFPLAACASAAVLFARSNPGVLADGIAVALLALASIVIAGLLVRTIVGILRGELRKLSG